MNINTNIGFVGLQARNKYIAKFNQNDQNEKID